MKKYSMIQILLTVASVSALLISNVITARQIELFGITMTGATLLFPLTYVVSDIFSEVYGYRWSRITCHIGFAMNLIMVLVFQATIHSPAPAHFENVEAYHIVFGGTPRIFAASLAAFWLGDLVNDLVFRRLKRGRENSHKGFGVRAITSSLLGELVDSSIFLPLAFWGQMPAEAMLISGLSRVAMKLVFETAFLPLTSLAVRRVSRHEAKGA